MWGAGAPPVEEPEQDHRRLINEVMRLMIAQELFPFGTAEPVAQPNDVARSVGATNNEAERALRGSSQARKTGRTNETLVGARRQTIVTSVLESLRLYLPTFALLSVLAEIRRWPQTGRSCFRELLETLTTPPPEESVLDRVLLHPSG